MEYQHQSIVSLNMTNAKVEKDPFIFKNRKRWAGDHCRCESDRPNWNFYNLFDL